MVRLQIQLEAEQHRDVKRRARRLGVSVSEVIRRSVAAHLDEDDSGSLDARIERAIAAGGRHKDPAGRTDVAARHDDVLATAYAATSRLSRRRR